MKHFVVFLVALFFIFSSNTSHVFDQGLFNHSNHQSLFQNFQDQADFLVPASAQHRHFEFAFDKEEEEEKDDDKLNWLLSNFFAISQRIIIFSAPSTLISTYADRMTLSSLPKYVILEVFRI